MNSRQNKVCIFWSIVFIIFIISCARNYQGYLTDLIYFSVFLTSGLGISIFFIPMFMGDTKEPTKEQKFYLLLFPILGGILVAFSLFYSSTVFTLKENYERLKRSYVESYYNVQELVEDGTYYHPDFFIDAFSNHRDYIDD